VQPAQEDSKAVAARTFREGSAAFERSDFVAGARAFEASFRAIPRAAAIYNAALCWDAAGDGPHAADAYAVALAKTDLHGAEAEKAAGRLRELEGKLGVIDVTAPEGAHVTVGDVTGPSPLRVHLPPGRYDVSVDLATGERETFPVTVRAGERAAVAATAAPASRLPPPPRAPPTRPADSDSGRFWGWTMLGGGAAFAAAAVVLGLETLSSLDTFNASGHHDSVSHDRAVTLRTLTNVSWGLAGALLAGGGTLLVVWSLRAGEPHASGIRPTGIAVVGHF
jgi:hypothetical protein